MTGLLPTGLVVGSSGHVSHTNQVHTKLNNACIDVKADYGAVGDGTTDDSGAIQAAINASAAGNIIWFPAGTYGVGATLQLKDSRAYLGTARGGVTIKQLSSTNLDAVVATDSWYSNSTSTNSEITIGHLKVDGNKAGQTSGAGHGLVLRTWDSLVSDVEVKNARGDGIRIANESRNSTLLSNTCVNTTVRDFFVHDCDGAGIRCIDGGNNITDWTLKDGWVANSGTYGIRIDNASGWRVENLHTYGNQLNAIQLNRCFGTRVEGNYVEDFGKAGASTTYYGIVAFVQGDATTTIVGNTVHFFGSLPASGNFTFIRVEGNYDTPVAAVVGNTVRGTGNARETGLSYGVGSASVAQISSTGNRVFNIGGTSKLVGAGVTSDAGV